ncbi:polymerase delta-interacting protein 3 [Orchesella cincta]|uniref:Polymerase delta-interacting protein 3 n=1 Tax=Orchesella cincta TaxID=48709 RepID=A0A1D2MJU6_ORCCI|nr:polymerase delta-interacting protein 3 [Orchesella cincta]
MMQRSGMRGFARANRGNIKDRLGFQSQSARQKGLLTTAGKRPAVKSRLGGVAAATIGQILDARQKINLNRVKKGRIGDARDKIEAQRRGKPNNNPAGNKFKNLTITATLDPATQNHVARGLYFDEESQRPGPRFTAGYPMESGGMFRSAAMDVYNSPPGPSNNSFGHDDGLFLTRTISNPAATANNYSSYSQQRSPLQSKPNISYRSYPSSSQHSEAMAMDEDEPPPRHMSLRLAPPATSEPRYKVLVSNLQPSVTSDDIVELFGDIGRLFEARLTSSGHAEVVYSKKADALKAVEAYHNRLLDGSPMRVFLETSGPSSSGGGTTTLKSAAGASIKLPKAASTVKIQPDISAIHKVLFNPSSSSATRGLFKAGQGQ